MPEFNESKWMEEAGVSVVMIEEVFQAKLMECKFVGCNVMIVE